MDPPACTLRPTSQDEVVQVEEMDDPDVKTAIEEVTPTDPTADTHGITAATSYSLPSLTALTTTPFACNDYTNTIPHLST
jgi:hypothetical protein